MKLLLENWRQFLLERRGKFVHGYKRKDYPEFDFDNFYDRLEKAGLLHLLGKTSKDYKFGNAHAKALKALKTQETGQSGAPEAKPTQAAVPSTKLFPSTPTTKTKEKPRIAAPKPVSGEGNILRGKLPSNQNRRYTVYISPGTDLNSPVTVALYFSGMGGSPHYGNIQKLARGARHGTILIVPRLTGKPQRSSVSVGPNFVQDVLRQISNNIQISKINYFAHSGGGATLARHINSLPDHSIIGNITLLDATYGWNAVKEMMDGRVNPSSVHFVVRKGTRTEPHAKKYADTGAKFTYTRAGHNRIGFNIG